VPATWRCCMCGRPLGCKRKNEKSDGWIDCDHVSGLLSRRHDRWPRWGPRSSPKHGCGFESRCNKWVFWILGSTDRHLVRLFHPGVNARFRRPLPARALSRPVPCGPSRCSIPAEAAGRFDRLQLAKIEVTNRLQRFGKGAVALVRRQGFQPGDVIDCKSTSVARVSCQRRARLRWSAGRGVRINGVSTARAAR
jgi:hypothetical protein